jgi:hypothetical protein
VTVNVFSDDGMGVGVAIGDCLNFTHTRDSPQSELVGTQQPAHAAVRVPGEVPALSVTL